MKQPTIFVSIAAMDDTEILPTIENLFAAAKHPERVYVGLGFAGRDRSTIKRVKALKNDRIRFTNYWVRKNSFKHLGVGKGRLRAAHLYRDEDYFLQVDCHSHFAKDWDVDMIQLHTEAKEASKNPKTIVTTYVGWYKYHPERRPVENGERNAYPFYIPGQLWVQAVPRWFDVPLAERYTDKFYPNVKFNPACAFGDRQFGRDTKASPDAWFYDEDLRYSIELFDAGFSFVYPNLKVFPITHLNADLINKDGGQRLFVLDYLSKTKRAKFDDKLRTSWFKYISDPKNAQKIQNYERYARVNVRLGAISEKYVPRGYR